MCGRYVSPDEAAIERAFHVGRGGNDPNPFVRRFNVLPTTDVPILRVDPAAGAMQLASARWGLVPHWWKQAKPPRFTINARSEEAAAKPMWRGPLRHARCLLPAEGWYEWQEVESIDPATGEVKRVKQPHYIRRPDARPFCFAGLLDAWQPPGASAALQTCAILTKAAAGPVAKVHERMPVVIPDALHHAWLDPRLVDADGVMAMIKEHAATQFEHYAVSPRVNGREAEGESLIEPLARA